MRNGSLYPRTTSEHRTDENGSSYSAGLLPTPEASDATGGRVASELGGQRPSGSKRAVTIGTAVAHLLKTPTAQLAVNGGSQHPDKRRAGGHGPTLADQVEHSLLPTPQAHDAVKGKTPEQIAAMRARSGAGVWNLNEVAETALLPTPHGQGEDGHGHELSMVVRATSGLSRTDRTVRRMGKAGALLPTPQAGLAAAGNTSRSGDRKDEPLLGAIAKHASLGDLTSQPSNDGSEPSGVLHQGQLSLDGLESD